MNKTIKNWSELNCCLWRRETFSSRSTWWKEKTKTYIFPSKQFMIYIAGKHLVDSSVHEISKLIKNDAKHSLWRIWEAVWLLLENDHLASINEFKSSRARLLTISGVTMYFNSWKFVIISHSNRLILWKKYVQKATSQSLFTYSKSN